MTLVPTSVTSAELVSLAGQINEGHGRVVAAAETTLDLAIEVGHNLLEAYELVPDGEWTGWVEDNCDFGHSTANHYQRVAHYAHELTDVKFIEEALLSLTGLPTVHHRGTREPHPPVLKEKARAMLAEGQTARQIGDQLGLNKNTVQSWRRSDQEIIAYNRKYSRGRAAARKALKEQEKRKAIMAAASPSVAELYSRLRLALEVADAAILDHADGPDAARFLRQARSALYRAEGRIVEALGVE